METNSFIMYLINKARFNPSIGENHFEKMIEFIDTIVSKVFGLELLLSTFETTEDGHVKICIILLNQCEVNIKVSVYGGVVMVSHKYLQNVNV